MGNLFKVQFVLLLFLSHVSGQKDKGRIMDDDEISGGKTLRKWDHKMSETFGGYRSIMKGERTEPSFYGKYVEPVLHAAEHTRRAVFGSNGKEWARAKDEIRSVGKGLHKMDNKYQNEYKSNPFLRLLKRR